MGLLVKERSMMEWNEKIGKRKEEIFRNYTFSPSLRCCG
jgi:hypothetical protein